jgi:ubiquinone biosynthesis protein COQ9
MKRRDSRFYKKRMAVSGILKQPLFFYGTCCPYFS